MAVGIAGVEGTFVNQVKLRCQAENAAIGRVVRYHVTKRKLPKPKRLWLPVGATEPVTSCSSRRKSAPP